MTKWILQCTQAIVVVLSTSMGMASAMTFTAVMMRGEPAIMAEGPIVPGDAGRLKKVLISKNKHSAGYYALILNSPGGNVKASFELSKLMDTYPVNTYVAPGTYCAADCASIVFIAGKEHIALPGARLGFQGCVLDGAKKISSVCNEKIADHAFAHGTAYGSVMTFIGHIPYGKVAWLDGKDADCWAINRYQISETPKNYEKCVFDAIRKVMEPKI